VDSRPFFVCYLHQIKYLQHSPNIPAAIGYFVIVLAFKLLAFEFPEEQLSHAHDTMSGKFIHAKDIQVNEMKNMESKKSDEYRNRVEIYKAFIQPTPPPHKR
jgi:hypothetical protein